MITTNKKDFRVDFNPIIANHPCRKKYICLNKISVHGIEKRLPFKKLQFSVTSSSTKADESPLCKILVIEKKTNSPNEKKQYHTKFYRKLTSEKPYILHQLISNNSWINFDIKPTCEHFPSFQLSMSFYVMTDSFFEKNKDVKAQVG